MNKTFLLIGLVLISLTSFGQNKETEFGLKGGLNYSSFIDSNDEDIPADYNGKIGFHIGGYISLGITEKLSIRPELLYSQQGSNFSIGGGDLNIFDPNDNFVTSIDGTIKESMILLPIILEYSLSEKFSIGFGPQFGYSLNREIEFDDNPFGGGFLKNDDSENFEIGLGIEFGYSLAENYGVSLRYNYGILERQNLHTSVIQLGMNYKIN